MRRAEAEWIQIVVHILDHVFAVFQAANRSGQPALAEQMGHFQNSCRDAARRIGLVATLVKAGDPYDPNLHKLSKTPRQMETGSSPRRWRRATRSRPNHPAPIGCVERWPDGNAFAFIESAQKRVWLVKVRASINNRVEDNVVNTGEAYICVADNGSGVAKPERIVSAQSHSFTPLLSTFAGDRWRKGSEGIFTQVWTSEEIPKARLA